MIDLERFAMTPEQVAMLSPAERRVRVVNLYAEAHTLVDYAIFDNILSQDRVVAGVCSLFSGGNDSTVLTHVFRHRIDYIVHANTTVGIEDTRRFVRATAAGWHIPLLEFMPDPGDRYQDLVLDRGFPGPGMHYKMFQRLKERGLRKARRQLVKNPRKQRVVFLAGRRRTESSRRANVPEFEREGSTVWVSPLLNWTKFDMNTYREMSGDVPRNQVSDLLHMSGECLCGAFAKKGELEEIEAFYPETVAEIRALEAAIAHRTDIPEYRKRWGWGGDAEVLKASRRTPRSGRLCSSCDVRYREGAAA